MAQPPRRSGSTYDRLKYFQLDLTPLGVFQLAENLNQKLHAIILNFAMLP